MLWKSIKIWVKNHPPSAATSSPTAQNTHVRWISITYTYANFLSLSFSLYGEKIFPFFSAHSKIPHCCCGGLKTLNDDWRKLALAAAEEIFLLSLVSLFFASSCEITRQIRMRAIFINFFSHWMCMAWCVFVCGDDYFTLIKSREKGVAKELNLLSEIPMLCCGWILIIQWE